MAEDTKNEREFPGGEVDVTALDNGDVQVYVKNRVMSAENAAKLGKALVDASKLGKKDDKKAKSADTAAKDAGESKKTQADSKNADGKPADSGAKKPEAVKPAVKTDVKADSKAGSTSKTDAKGAKTHK